MDTKSINTLEFPKILLQLTEHTSFSASEKLARGLRPTNKLEHVLERQARTSEAYRLLSEYEDVSIGGVRDIRPQTQLAARGGVLTPADLMEIKGTLISSRDLFRFFEKLPLDLPNLKQIANRLQPPEGLVEAISQIVDEKGEVKDSASQKLGAIRTDLKNANHRVMDKLTGFINSPNTGRMLQEAIITKRADRYVVPLRAEYKGRLKCVVQDQSASGATLFVEPMSVVELNNSRITLAKEEKEEVKRILAALSAKIGTFAGELQALVAEIAMLDFSFACAKYAFALDAVAPVLTAFPDDRREIPDPIMNLIQARHPLLDPKQVVPIDIKLEKGTHALVITGPNTGGKTISLKTAGLLALMAQSGLHIPVVSGSQMCVFTNVFADIGDEQSIEQSLSTFSGHITNIVRVLKRSGRRTLVLFDELGAGTDPQEGSALARAILSYMIKKRTPSLVATHYSELKAFAHSVEGVQNASVEFNSRSLKPTYRLLTGIPGRSNALAIAKRLGISDEILENARDMVNPADMDADGLLDEIHTQLDQARRNNAKAKQLRTAMAEEKRVLEERLERIEEERLQVLKNVRQEAANELLDVYAEINAIRKQVKASNKPSVEKKELRKKVDAIKEKLDEPVEKKRVARQPRRPLREGDRVYLRRLKTDGVVASIMQDVIEVQVGKMRIKVDPRDLERSKRAQTDDKKNGQAEEREISKRELFYPSPGGELKLLGMRADDAIEALERYLDAAQAAGLPYVRIVHGKGSGVLRQVVRENLKQMAPVKRWEKPQESEGGEGVTVVFLKTD